MNIQAGTILISAPALADANFEQVVIFINSHNEKGSTGFVVNKVFPRKLNELEAFKNDMAFTLYDGGPVDQEHLFVLHQRADLISESALINNSIYFGGAFNEVVRNLNNGSIRANDIKIFVGYCGWDDQQLEEEIKEGSWLAVIGNEALVFSEDADKLWEKLYSGIQ